MKKTERICEMSTTTNNKVSYPSESKLKMINAYKQQGQKFISQLVFCQHSRIVFPHAPLSIVPRLCPSVCLSLSSRGFTTDVPLKLCTQQLLVRPTPVTPDSCPSGPRYWTFWRLWRQAFLPIRASSTPERQAVRSTSGQCSTHV